MEVLLGMTIVQDPETKAVMISQRTYFLRMLANFVLDQA